MKLRITLLALALFSVAALTHAQTYPAKPVRIVVPFPAGGVLDRMTRVVGQRLAETWKQNVVVENRPGGTTIIATEFVARQPADGYTLLMMANTFVINPALRDKLPYDIERDFTAVSQLAYTPNVFVTHPSLPVKTMKDVIALAKSRPGELAYASIGQGTPQHLAGEMLKLVTGVNIIHVPYQGGAPSVTALLGGHVSMMFANLGEVQPYIDAGRLRLIAVATEKRVDTLKNIPTVAESGVKDLYSTSWFGMVAPAATPKDVIAKLHADIVRTLQMPDIRANLIAQNLNLVGSTPEQFATFIRSEYKIYADVIKRAGVKPE